jgi:integrase
MEREAVLLMRKARSKASDGRPTPAIANRLVGTLRVLLTFVEDRPRTFGLRKGWENPLRRSIKPLKEGEGHWPWEDDEIEQMQKTWKPHTFERVFFEHLRNTGQRGIDARLMTRKKYRNGELHVAQTKTGEEVWIPVLDEYKPILDDWLAQLPPDEIYIFPGKPGKPMSESSVHNKMHAAIDKAGLQTTRKNAPIDRDDRTLHGLRYTFAALGIEEGLPYDTIEAIVGHTTLAIAIKYRQSEAEISGSWRSAQCCHEEATQAETCGRKAAAFSGRDRLKTDFWRLKPP